MKLLLYMHEDKTSLQCAAPPPRPRGTHMQREPPASSAPLFTAPHPARLRWGFPSGRRLVEGDGGGRRSHACRGVIPPPARLARLPSKAPPGSGPSGPSGPSGAAAHREPVCMAKNNTAMVDRLEDNRASLWSCVEEVWVRRPLPPRRPTQSAPSSSPLERGH